MVVRHVTNAATGNYLRFFLNCRAKKSLLPALLQTGCAQAVQFQMPGSHLADAGNLFGQGDPVKIGPIDIINFTAAITDKVVVGSKVGIEEIAVVGEVQFPGYTQFIERGQGPVDRVYRDSRHLLLQSSVNIFGRRVILGGHQLFEYFKALVSELDPSTFADSSDVLKILIVEFGVGHINSSIKNYSYQRI